MMETIMIKKIIELFDESIVLSILESPSNYIVSVCDKKTNIQDATECIYAVNKKTFKVSEFSYFANPEEYKQAYEKVLYRHKELKR